MASRVSAWRNRKRGPGSAASTDSSWASTARRRRSTTVASSWPLMSASRRQSKLRPSSAAATRRSRVPGRAPRRRRTVSANVAGMASPGERSRTQPSAVFSNSWAWTIACQQLLDEKRQSIGPRHDHLGKLAGDYRSLQAARGHRHDLLVAQPPQLHHGCGAPGGEVVDARQSPAGFARREARPSRGPVPPRCCRRGTRRPRPSRRPPIAGPRARARSQHRRPGRRAA